MTKFYTNLPNYFSKKINPLKVFKCILKSRIRETPNLSTDADRSTNIYFGRRKKKKKNESGKTPCF